MKKSLVFVVDDEVQILQLLQSYLEKEGYDVATFTSGVTALLSFDQQPCDLWIIDITMPEMDGYTLCREIRQRGDTPVIIVSAKDEEIDRILGLELGSDDYISKPFSPRELLVRVKNILRRVHSPRVTPPEDVIHIGNMALSLPKRQVWINEQEVYFTTKEYALLTYLAQNRGDPLAREQIVETVWSYDYPGDMRQVDDLVKRVRRKLYDQMATATIETIWGYGYRMKAKE
ncbi:MAG: response regulator transcription factor [Symbiobacteriaceae bacterium]|nr:response regulator transcription factor [Symbiobacteriaceae bacterium]